MKSSDSEFESELDFFWIIVCGARVGVFPEWDLSAVSLDVPLGAGAGSSVLSICRFSQRRRACCISRPRWVRRGAVCLIYSLSFNACFDYFDSPV